MKAINPQIQIQLCQVQESWRKVSKVILQLSCSKAVIRRKFNKKQRQKTCYLQKNINKPDCFSLGKMQQSGGKWYKKYNLISWNSTSVIKQ
jgi:hypothetical protein